MHRDEGMYHRGAYDAFGFGVAVKFLPQRDQHPALPEVRAVAFGNYVVVAIRAEAVAHFADVIQFAQGGAPHGGNSVAVGFIHGVKGRLVNRGVSGTVPHLAEQGHIAVPLVYLSVHDLYGLSGRDQCAVHPGQHGISVTRGSAEIQRCGERDPEDLARFVAGQVQREQHVAAGAVELDMRHGAKLAVRFSEAAVHAFDAVKGAGAVCFGGLRLGEGQFAAVGKTDKGAFGH